MADEPKEETGEPSATHEISKTKSLKLQPSAEFAAEQATRTGPQISLPSSPASAETPAASAPEPAAPTPVEPSYTPAPDPLAQQMQAQVAPVEKPAPETPVAQPVVPAAFQAPEQNPGASKAASHHSPDPSQQFTLTSEAAIIENEASAAASLFNGLTLALGLLSSLSYIVLFHVTKNEWVPLAVVVVLALAAVFFSFKSYATTRSMNPLTVIGLVGATVGLLLIANIYIAEWALRSLFGGFGL